MIRIITLLLVAACFVGCASSGSKTKAPPSTVRVTNAPPRRIENAPVMADGLPSDDSWLSAAQITELKHRLNKLEIGMPRTKVLQILDITSFNVRYYEHANTTGMTIQIRMGHTLSLGFKPADYDPVLRWAKFDLEVWPQQTGKDIPTMAPVDKKFVAPSQR